MIWKSEGRSRRASVASSGTLSAAMLMVSNCWHPSNTSLPITVSESGRVMRFRLLQPLNSWAFKLYSSVKFGSSSSVVSRVLPVNTPLMSFILKYSDGK